jgi:hypothetical protein
VDTNHDEIADSKSKTRARGVGTLTVHGPAFLGQQSKDLFRKLGGRTGKTQKGMAAQSLVGSCWSGSRRQTVIEREAKRPTNSNATNITKNVSFLICGLKIKDRAAVCPVTKRPLCLPTADGASAAVGWNARQFGKQLWPAKTFLSLHANTRTQKAILERQTCVLDKTIFSFLTFQLLGPFP